MLELSKEKSRVASENADFKAFSEAEVDIKELRGNERLLQSVY